MTGNWIREKASGTLHPPQVESTLASLAHEMQPAGRDLRQEIESFPLGEAALLHLLAVSSVCASRIAHDSMLLPWLSRPDICASDRGRNRMLAELRLQAEGAIAADNFMKLRQWKGREMVRIALREIAGVAALEETTMELSLLAEICVREVLRHWQAELTNRFGAPQAEFAVLGLGKLGGSELNHSSDIDVIFLYSEEGQISPMVTNHEWFNRLATKIFETFSAKHPAGPLFRMDARLRPEGTAGPMARSLDSLENYYAGFGEMWERLALIKARGIAGSAELAYDFLRQHQPFIYPRNPTPELLEEIASIKRRIERDIVGHGNLDRNVKLGAGGIREVEFVVQALQLLHGARNAFLQETSTLKALAALAELELLPRSEALNLNRAYRFLRQVEHRLQIEAEQQTHTLPSDPAALERLARSLSLDGTPALTETLRQHTDRVRSIFRRVISEGSGDERAAAADLTFFADRSQAEKALTELGQGRAGFHVAARTRQIFRKLRPLLIEDLAGCADPDATLTQFVRFVEAYGLRSMLLELMASNPRLLELVLRTFDSSRFASDLLIRRPALLEELTRAGALDGSLTAADHLAALQHIKDARENFDAVRAYRQAQWLRILVRDVLGIADRSRVANELSALTEGCLLFVHEQLTSGDAEITVIALGKFGGGEQGYGGDIDVAFIGENPRVAQELIIEMGRTTSEGAISALDPRLRPDGEKGLLTCSLAGYENYYATRAQLWEAQALTRARAIAGKDGAAFIALAKRVWSAAGQRDDLFVQIDGMRERIRRERGSGSEILEFKTGLGGMVEAEFLVQALQMRSGTWEQHFRSAVSALRENGLLAAPDAETLQTRYDFLRRCEAVLRRYDDRPVSKLPADEADQRRLAMRMGAGSLASFGEEYRETRETIHALYTRYIV